jgi:hypothetical protein
MQLPGRLHSPISATTLDFTLDRLHSPTPSQCKGSLCLKLQHQCLAETFGGNLPHELELVPDVPDDGVMMFAISGSCLSTDSHKIWPLGLAWDMRGDIALVAEETNLDPGPTGHLESQILQP